MAVQEMYYNRVIPKSLQDLLMPDGALHWLYSFVKSREDLDFLIGANKSKKWIYVYRGITRLLDIHFCRGGLVNVSAASKYIDLAKKNGLEIYGHRKLADLNFMDDFNKMVCLVENDLSFKRYYDGEKEGFFQNIFSRQFGINSKGNEDFVVVDKEAVIGYKDTPTKKFIFGKKQMMFLKVTERLSRENPKLYGAGIKPFGRELDFLAVNKAGDVLLVEFKHGSSASGIYLSPVQIGLYYNIFQEFMKQYRDTFLSSINNMLKQKKEMGLISQNWPEVSLTGKIIPVLVIAEFNQKSSALDTFREVLKIYKDELKDDSFLSELRVYEYDKNMKLNRLEY